ncbi:MAG: YggS family pyridoxal phosphate-dependent enzyme [bacterium]
MGIAENLVILRERIPPEVKIIIVTKNQEPEEIAIPYSSGHRAFGENKVQEVTRKFPLLPSDIEWHFIGHLQSNKVRYIASFIHMIHSIDSLKLLQEVNKEGKKNSRVIRCLLQFHIASEETKFGLSLSEARDILISPSYQSMENIRIDGVMGMATFTDDEKLVHSEFINLRGYFEILKAEYFKHAGHFCELSMGMSSDYLIAVAEGATLVRIGSAIFS